MIAGTSAPGIAPMTLTIRFFVSGVPKAMSVGASVAFKKGATLHHFQKRNNAEWSILVGQIGRTHAPGRPLAGAVSFTALFHIPRPRTLPKRVRLPLKRPDIDNLLHKLTDQFNGVFWEDDSQIVDLIARKRFALDGRTGIEIIVEQLGEQPELN